MTNYCPNGAEAQSPGLPRAAWLPWVDAARDQPPQRGCGRAAQKPQPRWGSLCGGVRSQGRPEAGQPWALSLSPVGAESDGVARPPAPMGRMSTTKLRPEPARSPQVRRITQSVTG